MTLTGAVSRLVITISGIRIRVRVRVSEVRLRITVRIVPARIARVTVSITPVVIRPLVSHVRLRLIHNHPVPRSWAHHNKPLTTSEDGSHYRQKQSAN